MICCPDAPSWSENLGRAFALGMGALGWVVFWFGIAGFLEPWLLWVILLWRTFVRNFWKVYCGKFTVEKFRTKLLKSLLWKIHCGEFTVKSFVRNFPERKKFRTELLEA